MHSYEFIKNVEDSTSAAKIIIPEILKIFPATKNVIDVGGGIGQWCKIFKEYGVNEVLCVDSDSIRKKDLLIKEDEFIGINFENNFPWIQKKYDLTLSLEFAEHINFRHNKKLVKFLTSLSSIIIFSAAIPNQGGYKHINEQRQVYWKNLFNGFGYEYLDAIRPLIISKKEIPFYYRQNIVIYIKKERLVELRDNITYNIDPNEFEIVSLRILNSKPGIATSFKSLVTGIIRKLKI